MSLLENEDAIQLTEKPWFAHIGKKGQFYIWSDFGHIMCNTNQVHAYVHTMPS